jgi:amidophosphoribosyltransferase
MDPELHPHPRHECGVFGVFGHPEAAEITYFGLYALQHRGQESAGIVTSTGPGQPFHVHKAMGLVSHVFNKDVLAGLEGTRAIGHVRYSTTGSSRLINAQPIVVDCLRGQIAVAHNGNLTNSEILRNELEHEGSIFQTTVDSEVIPHLIAQPARNDRRSGLIPALRQLQGAFSLVLLTEHELIGVRDPNGFRPLCLGRLDGAWVISSETCAFDLIRAEYVRDVEPGEVVVINESGLRSFKPFPEGARPAFCIFEHVYFARPDSVLGGQNVAMTRKRMGAELAHLHPVDADIVIPVPDSGSYAAQGYSEASGIPYELAYVRNHYIGRTFIQPSQRARDMSVRVKLNLIGSLVKGKRVVVVDDSIVRGTTVKTRVVGLREAGAKEVHIRVSCPPHRFACHYGIDFPDPKKLIANQMTRQEIAQFLGADSIGYLDVPSMIKATRGNPEGFCLACFTGDYPVPYSDRLDKEIHEKRGHEHAPLVAEDGQPPLL